jgi:AhpD family alkylhydroperoxidase
MKLDERTMRLIAVGASIAANCQACLQTHVTKAREEGIGEIDIVAAIEIGQMVRRGASSKIDKFALSLTEDNPAFENATVGGCGCNS